MAAALLVPFTLFMWRIFGTKETPQQEGAAGINFSVPEGREQQIESSKQKVVAKVRTEAEDLELTRRWCEGATEEELSAHFQRKPGAIRSRIEKLDLERLYGKRAKQS